MTNQAQQIRALNDDLREAIGRNSTTIEYRPKNWTAHNLRCGQPISKGFDRASSLAGCNGDDLT